MKRIVLPLLSKRKMALLVKRIMTLLSKRMVLQPVYPIAGQADICSLELLFNSFSASENNPPYCRNIIENLIVVILVGDIVPQTQTWAIKSYIVSHKSVLRNMPGGGIRLINLEVSRKQ